MSNLRNIANLIKKADGFSFSDEKKSIPQKPSSTIPASSLNPNPFHEDGKSVAQPNYRPSQTYLARNYSPEVKKMQDALQSLAAVVIATDNSHSVSKDSYQGDASQQIASARKSFSDFLTQNYLNNASTKGVEWSTNAGATSKSSKERSTTNLYELSHVMDTFDRLGKAHSEFHPDGVWDFRTNNALRNVIAFGEGILQLENDFNIKSKTLTYSDLNQLSKLIPVRESDLDKAPLEVKSTNATYLTEGIEKIKLAFEEYREKILSNANYAKFISGQAPFDTYTNTGAQKDPAQLTPNQSNALAQSEGEILGLGPKGLNPLTNNNSLDLDDIKNVEAFKKKLIQLGFVGIDTLNTDNTHEGLLPSQSGVDTQKAVQILETLKQQLDRLKAQQQGR